MTQRQRLSLYIPGSPPGTLPESTYTPTPTSDRRRSLISLDSLSLGSLKPSRARLQKYWPGAKSPTATTTNKPTRTTHDLSALIMLAGEQMGALADPRLRKPSTSSRTVSRQQDDPQLWQDLEMSLPKSATAHSRHSTGSIQRKPLPTNAASQYCPSPAAVPAPSRAPPPPPIPELSAVNFHCESVKLAESPPPPVLPLSPTFPSTVRRRAKTPVHHIGQLEAAQRSRNRPLHFKGNMDGVNRMSSVSTIAREYRELAVHSEMDIPDVPKIDASYLLRQGIIELPATNSQEGHLLGTSCRHQRTQSCTSDEGTLMGSEPDTCPSLTHSNSPVAEMSDGEDDGPPALASLRFQIGLELLTKELSTAFADQSSRRPKDGGASSAGLQIWVMIEAYERLREQLDANKPTEDNMQARDAIDSWIRALYTIHNNIASEGAADDSEYESDQ
ncbi:hypothetical protein LLEC1_04925 [Akanthomyces lecanii]|uniref:Mating-type switching protein swi10 n=1 Tax=Cordyceps confragosa TaxID=2714763 RepID=A0A179I847_CORDF|nr:hypothetical protein LLEC1_04925 [Akanthomyces lecanii]